MAFTFEFITDERFGGTKKELKKMDKELKDVISSLDGVALTVERPLRKVEFEDGQDQWRINYRVSKSTRKHTWNDVQSKINGIQAPVYKRV